MNTRATSWFETQNFEEVTNTQKPELIDVHHVTDAIVELEKHANGPWEETMKGEILKWLSELPGVTGAKFTKDAEVLFLAYAKESQENRENLARKLWVHPLIMEDNHTV